MLCGLWCLTLHGYGYIFESPLVTLFKAQTCHQIEQAKSLRTINRDNILVFSHSYLILHVIKNLIPKLKQLKSTVYSRIMV